MEAHHGKGFVHRRAACVSKWLQSLNIPFSLLETALNEWILKPYVDSCSGVKYCCDSYATLPSWLAFTELYRFVYLFNQICTQEVRAVNSFSMLDPFSLCWRLWLLTRKEDPIEHSGVYFRLKISGTELSGRQKPPRAGLYIFYFLAICVWQSWIPAHHPQPPSSVSWESF